MSERFVRRVGVWILMAGIGLVAAALAGQSFAWAGRGPDAVTVPSEFACDTGNTGIWGDLDHPVLRHDNLILIPQVARADPGAPIVVEFRYEWRDWVAGTVLHLHVCTDLDANANGVADAPHDPAGAPPIDVTFVHPLDEPTTPTTIMHGTQHRGLVTGNFALVMPDTATLPGELCSRAAVFSDARGTGHRFSLPAFDISGSSCVPVTRSATTTTIGAPATVPPTTTTTAPTTTTTLAATTTSRPTTTTTGEVAATSTSQASTTTTRVLATTVPPPATLGTSFAATTTTVKVLGAVVTRAVKGQVGPAALAATGGSPANLLAFAGVALILGGITMLFGRRAPRTERS